MRAMMFLIAPVAAALVAMPRPPAVRYPTKRPAMHARRHVATRTPHGSVRANALQSRVARMERLAFLVRREALLHDFLIKARTETPVFHDDRTYRFDPGIEISATHVAADFIGSPIIRARVRNRTASRQMLLLEADLVSASGARSRAGAALTLEPGETRTVELLCPARVAPASLIWSTSPL
jgi:hypothetical protein